MVDDGNGDGYRDDDDDDDVDGDDGDDGADNDGDCYDDVFVAFCALVRNVVVFCAPTAAPVRGQLGPSHKDDRQVQETQNRRREGCVRRPTPVCRGRGGKGKHN